MTRLIHLGDFHAAPGPRNADRYRALEQIQAVGASLPHLGAWLWPGDLNDARMSIEDRNRLAEALMDMARVAPVVLTYGNHDLPGDLDVFAHLRSVYPVYVVDRPTCLRLQLATGVFATIFVLPYPQKGTLVGAGVATGDVVGTAADLLEPIFMLAAAELAAARAQGDLTLMMGHVNVAGSQLSNGQPSIGHEIELNPRHLDRLGDIPKLLNHVHKPQVIAGAYYAGSVCRLDYGEIEAKRFLVVDCADGRYSVTSRPIDIAPMWHIDGRLDRHGFSVDSYDETLDAEIHQRITVQGWAGCDVRVRYRYRASEKPVLDERTVRDAFAGALRLKVEPVAEPDRELRAPDVAAAKTLPEKLAAYRKVEQLEPSIAEKLAALERLEPAAVLAQVAERMRAIEAREIASVAA